MLTIIIFVSECRLWRLFGTILKQIRAQRRAAPGCFEFTGAKGCCGGSSRESCKKFNLAVVRGSETQTKRKERGIVVASPLQSIINDQVEAMRDAGISIITLPCRRTMRWSGQTVFLKTDNYHRRGFNKRKSSSAASYLITAMRTIPTWLIFCLRNGKTKSLNRPYVRFVAPWRILTKKRFSVSLRERDDCLVLLRYTKHPLVLQ